MKSDVQGVHIALPQASVSGGLSLTEALKKRRSCREFSAAQLSLDQIAQLCWAAQGVTHPEGYRTSPSAGALYPLTLFVVDRHGVYEYRPREHTLVRSAGTDLRKLLQRAALDQECVADAAACFVIAISVEHLAARYAERAEQFCLLEAGHVAQNLLLQATSLGLAGVPVGAFRESQIDRILRLPSSLRSVYLVPIGYPRN
ncbi:MAG TPA: SagB/ThcOx family dehydrogenase [Planctomycetaceae bacterium]|nr:SagB/ThcOx family dehydrogenase [Planctomycetaceae bacterium]